MIPEPMTATFMSLVYSLHILWAAIGDGVFASDSSMLTSEMARY